MACELSSCSPSTASSTLSANQRGQHFVLVLMEVLSEFDNLLTFSTPVTAFNLAEHRSVSISIVQPTGVAVRHSHLLVF